VVAGFVDGPTNLQTSKQWQAHLFFTFLLGCQSASTGGRELTDELPKGFYKGEDGIQRFWDGNQGLEPQESDTRRAFPKKLTALAAGIVLLTSAGIFGATAFIQQRNEAAAEEARIQAAEEQIQLEQLVEAKFRERQTYVMGFFQTVVKRSGCEVMEPAAIFGVEFDQRNLTIDGRGDKDILGADYSTVECLVDTAGMTPAIKSRWSNTNSLQGLLEDDWTVLEGDAEVSASWSYHPSSGPSVAMELNSVFFEAFDYEKHKDLVSLD
jgi:hypothetical protein